MPIVTLPTVWTTKGEPALKSAIYLGCIFMYVARHIHHGEYLR